MRMEVQLKGDWCGRATCGRITHCVERFDGLIFRLRNLAGALPALRATTQQQEDTRSRAEPLSHLGLPFPPPEVRPPYKPSVASSTPSLGRWLKRYPSTHSNHGRPSRTV